MPKLDGALAALEKQWSLTAQLTLGKPSGSMLDYSSWLAKLPEPVEHTKSSLTGKELAFSVLNYCKGSKRIAYDEIDYAAKFEPLGINEIKDMDSLVSSVRERAYYAGGVILGNSQFAEKSSNISNSFYTYQSGRVDDSKYIAYSSLTKDSEAVFGSNFIGKSAHIIRGLLNYRCKRTIETWNANSCSDTAFCHNITGCSNALFCFNVKSKRYAIGNLELEKSKFVSIHSKLCSEILEELSGEKRLPSLAELASVLPPALPSAAPGVPLQQKKASLHSVEEAFAKTTSLLLGKPYAAIRKFSAWLEENTISMESWNSILSKRELFIGKFGACEVMPKSRLVTFEEAEMLGRLAKAESGEINGLSWQGVPKILSKMGFMTPEFKDGVGENLVETPVYSNGVNCLHVFDSTYSKNCAYCFWARDSESLFGTSLSFGSSFCLKCYNSSRLSRCFEVDSSCDCSGCYYCHNCENVHDSMFCFNAKNLRHAIGNVEVSPELFAKAKTLLQERLCRELDENGRIALNIFNLGCTGKR